MPDLNQQAKVTVLLGQWREGDADALSELTPIVYDELHRLARRAFRREDSGHTLQATALVSEAYLQLAAATVDWQDRSHFFRLAARMMRRILVNHAAARLAEKRGGDRVRVTLQEDVMAAEEATVDVLALDSALEALAERSESDALILELFYFGGLSYADIGRELQISEATVKRRLRFARAWLRSRL